MADQTDTRDRIMAAALETVRDVGITGASARAIASKGEFNQALIFYHFGSVTNLLVEAAKTSSSDRVASYRDLTGTVDSLTSLVVVARRLHDEAEADGSVAVLTQLMAGAAADEEMGKAILSGFQEWIGLVEDALKEALNGQPLEDVIPPRQTAYSIAALFLGIELMTRLDPEASEANDVFDSLEDLAATLEAMPSALTRFLVSRKS